MSKSQHAPDVLTRLHEATWTRAASELHNLDEPVQQAYRMPMPFPAPAPVLNELYLGHPEVVHVAPTELLAGGNGLHVPNHKRPNHNREQLMILKTWFEEHSNDPYPSYDQKTRLAAGTGMDVRQVEHCTPPSISWPLCLALSIACCHPFLVP